MYHSFHIQRLMRYLIFDLALIFAALILTSVGKRYLSAATLPDGVDLPILMYHSVTETAEREYCVTPETLEQDLAYLKEKGYETVSPETLYAYTTGTGSLPQHPIMLTFDDGFYNNYSLVLPLLEEYDMCAVISVVGIFTDVYAADAPHNDVYSYLTWEDLRALLDSGRITLGSHTYDMHSHDSRQGCAIQAGEDEEDYHTALYTDLSTLQSRFLEELEYQPIVFAYPYGFTCPESKPVLQECGFLLTLNCLEQTNVITRDPSCLYGLNRFNRSGGCDTATFMQRCGITADQS